MLALKRSGIELRRDVIFAALADEEAGGEHGARALVSSQPGALRRRRRSSSGRRDQRGRRLLDDRRRATLLHDPGGREGHLLDEDARDRLARPRLDAPPRQRRRSSSRPRSRRSAPTRRLEPARVIPVVADFLEALGLDEVARLAATDPAAAASALERDVSDPFLRRSIDAMLRDTVTPTVLHAGKKVNVIAGFGRGGDRRSDAARHRPGGARGAPRRRRRGPGHGRVSRHASRGRVAGRRGHRAGAWSTRCARPTPTERPCR